MLLKKMLPALLVVLLPFMAVCQDDARVADYVNKYKEIAIREMLRTGVPASITLAQGILESQSGESDLAKKSNNHFGIKCKPEWTGDRVYHDDDEKGECFRVYTSVEQSYIDHSDFLKNRPYYTFLFKLDPTDYEGWAKGLKKAGYATSSTYAQQLISLIQRYHLQDYTLIALQRSKQHEKEMFTYADEKKPGTPVVQTAEVSNTGKPDAGTFVAAAVTDTAAPAREAVEVVTVTANNTADATPAVAARYDVSSYPQSPFTINGCKVILAKEGTSLLALANEFGVSYSKLLEFNELDGSSDILSYDQLIFLVKKAKKGSRDFHIVEKNETLETIAQKEGVQLEAILAFNRIPKGRQPVFGEKIYLKANSPVTPKLVASN